MTCPSSPSPRAVRRVFLDEGSYSPSPSLAGPEVEEICGRYLLPLCSLYWAEGCRERTARPLQEALAWHRRMLRARVHAAERGAARGLLDSVLGGRPLQVELRLHLIPLLIRLLLPSAPSVAPAPCLACLTPVPSSH